MKTHTLGFIVNAPEDSERYPNFTVTVDDHKEQSTFLLLPLELSMKADGVYPILNCTCGEWGCGGYYVKVKNTPEYIIWEEFYGSPKQQKKVEAVHALSPVYFKRSDYESVVKELLQLKEKYKWEANVYRVDKERYEKEGLDSLYNLK